MNNFYKEIAETPKTVGERLRLWRKLMMWRLLDVKKVIGVSQGSLSDQENNISLPSANTLTQLCLKTDLNICWLLTGIGPVTKKAAAAEDTTAFEFRRLIITHDKNLREMVDSLIIIYRGRDESKKALLKGFLIGAI